MRPRFAGDGFAAVVAFACARHQVHFTARRDSTYRETRTARVFLVMRCIHASLGAHVRAPRLARLSSHSFFYRETRRQGNGMLWRTCSKDMICLPRDAQAREWGDAACMLEGHERMRRIRRICFIRPVVRAIGKEPAFFRGLVRFFPVPDLKFGFGVLL